ncbi:hypothetical protein FE997_21175 [Salmonella enterica subsp. enterica serovar Newport]|nr:hypothetical protein FE997_21175 [Salmonella enterica subsp. enterica serovar Newport]
MLLAGNTSIVLLSAAVSPVWVDDNASAASCFFTCMLNNHCNKSLRITSVYYCLIRSESL